jgi:undecaprenyl-diphosphatase
MPNRKIILFCFSGSIFTVFILFSYLVSKEIFNQFDFDTTVKFQNHISRRFDFPFSIYSLAGSIEVTGFLWLILFIYSFIKRYFWMSLGLFLFWIGLSIELFGKIYLFHPSPPFMFFRGIGFNFPMTYVHTESSYPSGHVYRTAFLVFFLIVLFYLRRFKNSFLLSSGVFLFLVLMVVSRIYLGEHWTTDVLGGVILGCSIGLFSGIFIPQKVN